MPLEIDSNPAFNARRRARLASHQPVHSRPPPVAPRRPPLGRCRRELSDENKGQGNPTPKLYSHLGPRQPPPTAAAVSASPRRATAATGGGRRSVGSRRFEAHAHTATRAQGSQAKKKKRKQDDEDSAHLDSHPKKAPAVSRPTPKPRTCTERKQIYTATRNTKNSATVFVYSLTHTPKWRLPFRGPRPCRAQHKEPRKEKKKRARS